MKNNNKLKIIPLGGMSEIGKNMTLLEYRDEIVIIDSGMTFPEETMLGIDVVIPDISYLIKNKEKIKGLVLTHGHEDHIGAVPYILKKINIPIYGTPLTIGLIENKLKEHNLSNSNLNVVNAGDTVKLGKMEAEWIRVNHSIPDSCGIAIKTPLGVVYHTGDFKIDLTPISGKPIDLYRITELGKKGVLAMIGESTNVLRSGYTMSEKTVGETFDRLFAFNNERRIIVATFASNVHRVQQIINAAEKYGRKVALSGRSMLNVMDTAQKLGYIKIKKGTLIDINNIKKYDDDKLVLITTGSQGEPMSALSRIASDEHRKIQLTPNDLIILSATPIPGNEVSVNKVINNLIKRGAKVIYKALTEIHVSGHACEEELKLILNLINPKYFIPAHGESQHQLKHAELAKSLGISEDNIFILKNGNCLEISQKEAKLAADVPSGNILVDGLGIGDVGNIVLRDRKHLSEDGLIIINITISKTTKKLITGPDIISRGFVYVRESENLMENIKEFSKSIIDNFNSNNIENSKRINWNTLKLKIKDSLKGYIFEKTKRNPMILPIITEV